MYRHGHHWDAGGGCSYLGHHMVPHGVLLWGGEQGGLWWGLGVRLLGLWRAGEQAAAGLGNLAWGTQVRTHQGQALKTQTKQTTNIKESEEEK